jgi:hypothetical protein
MKRIHFAAALLVAAVAWATAPTLLAQADEPSVDLSNLIGGRYNGVAGPGNQLHLVVQPKSAGANGTFLYDVTIQGKYEGKTIQIFGSLRIDREGKAARLTWRNADSGASRGTQRSCDFPMKRAGDAFDGQTLRDQCMTALQLPTPGTWALHVEPGTITIRSVETGETLRFAKSAERAAR